MQFFEAMKASNMSVHAPRLFFNDLIPKLQKTGTDHCDFYTIKSVFIPNPSESETYHLHPYCNTLT